MFAVAAPLPESVSYGTPEKGRIENAWQLPSSGPNYAAYSIVGVSLGRNYVHSQVYRIVLDAYATIEKKAPTKKFVYGETGWAKGGRIRPHKTHRNGLSVDFFVPVIDEEGKSVPLPTGMFNKLGYAIEFNSQGKFKNYSIDFESMADHLLALKEAADKHNVKIKWVIFDNELQKLLFKTSRGPQLQKQLVFSKKTPWIRHDEHYHVDFIVPSKELR